MVVWWVELLDLFYWEEGVVLSGAGVIGTGPTGAGAGRVGGLGRYSGPVWPQPGSRPISAAAAAIFSARGSFTIRITG